MGVFSRSIRPTDEECGLDCGSERITKGSFRSECDINVIMARYAKTGQLPAMIKENPQYGDFSDVPSYLDAFNRVQFAQEQFNALPAAVRAECVNDPSVFLQRVKDPAFAQKHKLAITPEVVRPDVSVVSQPEAAPAAVSSPGAPSKGSGKGSAS